MGGRECGFLPPILIKTALGLKNKEESKMELRVLRYFLAVAQTESISKAAEQLHMTQPTLSRQLTELEQSLNTTLFHRGKRNRKVELTEEGLFLRKRAEEIIALADRTQAAFTGSDDSVAGDIYLGAGECDEVRLLARVIKSLHDRYPHIHYHISSGDMAAVEAQLDQGLIDFGLMLGPVDGSKYDVLALPNTACWGVLMQKNAPLAKKSSIRPRDLWDKPLILSRQSTSVDLVIQWLRKRPADLNIVAYYSLAYNAALLAEEGLGYTLALDRIINTTGDSGLCFRPLEPPIEVHARIAWKKHQFFSHAAALFLRELQTYLEESPDEES